MRATGKRSAQSSAAVLALIISLSACGLWGPGSGRIVCEAAPPTAGPSDGSVSAPASYPALAELPSGRPASWTPKTYKGLGFATPPTSVSDVFGEGDGFTCLVWTGVEPFGNASDGTPAVESLVISARNTTELDGSVRPGTEDFSAISVPGADEAIARIQSYTYSADADEWLAGAHVMKLVVYVQAGSSFYVIDGDFAPDRSGDARAREFLGTLRIP